MTMRATILCAQKKHGHGGCHSVCTAVCISDVINKFDLGGINIYISNTVVNKMLNK